VAVTTARRTRATPEPPTSTSDGTERPVTGRRAFERLGNAALWACGAAWLVLVTASGEPGWSAVRAAVVVAIVAGVAALHRSRSTASWVAVFAVGAVSLAAGVGIGGPHLAKGGSAIITTAGLVCLVGGAVLVLGSGAHLVRAVSRWWRPVVAVVLIVAALLTTFVGAQALAATNVPRTDLGTATPADHGLAHRDVTFETDDGVTLSGWYVPSRNGAAVVALHGAGSTRSAVLPHAAVLAEHGYGVLLFDARGHGRSDGRAMDFGWYGDLDTDAAVSFLVERPEVDADRIAALGLSMGGEEAIGAAAADPRLRAVVAEGATTRSPADKAWLDEAFGWRGRLQQGIEELVYGTTDLLTAAHPPIGLRDAATAMAPRSLLLITAGAVPDEARAADHIRGGAPSTVEVWTVDGADHTGALDTDPDGWEQRVTEWLDAALAPTP
jgi:dienelactone hydrolase